MRRALLPLTLVLAACSDALPPARPTAYEFAIPLRSGFPLIFHWTPATLPMRVWVEPVGELPAQTVAAIRTWERGALYGEFTAVLVRDTAQADVIIHRGDAVQLDPSPDGAILSGCYGATKIEVELDTTITLPFRTTLFPRLGASADEVSSCFALVVTHELGHAMGLFLHSDDPGDIMYERPNPRGLSARDQATFATLYHTTPTVRIPAGR
jgi:predicted Zn-dependent protease